VGQRSLADCETQKICEDDDEACHDRFYNQEGRFVVLDACPEVEKLVGERWQRESDPGAQEQHRKVISDLTKAVQDGS